MMIFEDLEFWVLGMSFEEIGKYDIKANTLYSFRSQMVRKRLIDLWGFGVFYSLH